MDNNNSLQKIRHQGSVKKLNEGSALLKRGLQDLGIWPKNENGSLKQTDEILCLACTKLLKKDSAFCSYCGTKIMNLDISLPTKPDYSIGDIGPAGGLIFYINPDYEADGWKYLEAAPSDQRNESTSFMNWYNGIKICDNLVITSKGTEYNDWFMPSKDDLNLMYNLYQNGIGSFEPDYYWSSSEFDVDLAWVQYFGNGSQYYYLKDNLFRRVRAARASN